MEENGVAKCGKILFEIIEVLQLMLQHPVYGCRSSLDTKEEKMTFGYHSKYVHF